MENVLIEVVGKRIRMVGVYVGERVITDLTPYGGWRVHVAPTSVKISFSSSNPLISLLKRITYLQVTRLFITYIVDLA